MKITVAIIAVFLLSAGAYADVVHLTDGSTIEGKVTEEDGKIKIEQKQGYILIAKHLVERIEKGPTKDELLKEKLAKIDRKDSQALREVAKWCKEVGLADEAREIEKEAMRTALNQKWETVSHTDAKAVLEFATWCKIEGYDSDTVEHFLYVVISIDPDHAGAREMLGYRRFRGEWLPQAEIERIKNLEYEEKMRLSGMVKYNGEWLKPEAAAFLAERERIDREKRELEEERERLRDLELRLGQEADQVGKERSNLETEWRERQRERDLLACDRAALAALAVNLANERAYLCDLKRELEELKKDLERQRGEIDQERRRICDEEERLRYSWDRSRIRREDTISRDCCPVVERPKDTNNVVEKERYPIGRQSSSRKEPTDSRNRTRR
jgi:hypothetical protein